MNPCGGTGWTPVPTVPLEQPPTMFDLIATTINLHSSEISWLLNNQVSAVEISNFLSNSKSTVNPITNLLYYPLANPKAIVAARSFLQIAISGNALTKLETDEFNILVPNLQSPQN